MLLLHKKPQINLDNVDKGKFWDCVPTTPLWYYVLYLRERGISPVSWCLEHLRRHLLTVTTAVSKQLKSTTQHRPVVTLAEWSWPTLRFSGIPNGSCFHCVEKMSFLIFFIKRQLFFSSACPFLFFCLGEKQRGKVSLHICFNSGPLH